MTEQTVLSFRKPGMVNDLVAAKERNKAVEIALITPLISQNTSEDCMMEGKKYKFLSH